MPVTAGGLRAPLVIVLLVPGLLLTPAVAQDVRGLEVCTAEKQMERRTSCLQSNVEFLQQSLAKTSRDAQDALAAANRRIVALEADVVALKNALAAAEAQLAGLKKARTEAKPDKK